MHSSETGPLNSRLQPLARAALLIAGAAVVVMTLVEAWQVIARYVLNDSPGWTEPLALLMLNTAMSFGAAAGVFHRSHFGFFILVHIAPAPLRRLMEAFSALVIAGLGAVLAFWGATLLVDGWGVRMAGTVLPQGATFLPLCIAGALMVLFALDQVGALWRPATPARTG